MSLISGIHRELYQKDLHDPDNHDAVITHLEPDILECEIRWALGSIIANKPNGGGCFTTSANWNAHNSSRVISNRKR